LNVGDKLPVVTKGPIERLQLVKYAGASGDWNRIHFEEGFAIAAGYPSVFAHGMLSMAFLGEVVSKWVGPHRVRKIGCRFKAITWPGDVVTCHGEITALRTGELGEHLADVKLWAETQKGTVTVEGTATVVLPAA
jgi:acyl dehydratase